MSPAEADSPTFRLNSGLETIGRSECLRLLAGEDFGRLGVVVGGMPDIIPLNYVLDADGAIVFRTGPGTKVIGALGGPVAFEVDRLDREGGCGWSVVVQGSMQRVAPAEAVGLQGRMAAFAVHPRGADKPYLFRVVPAVVSGRRILPPRPPPATPP
ncbi:MAG: pyridoxamine 5'-phosphate oxidase family protein [Actinomycetota bacterium]|nr:pyridoxamine 5'-phosphate oxidase family protein [Actinomycetota bacterium]MDQ6945006.1 pyridoxamine 5'-phosphate oxidase family protein [Actinomycetota bacterium]